MLMRKEGRDKVRFAETFFTRVVLLLVERQFARYSTTRLNVPNSTFSDYGK